LPGVAEDVCKFVECTAKAGDNPICQASVLGAFLVDADMAVLGRPREGYITYSKQTRQEYKRFSDEEWAMGRAMVLQQFLDRSRIYQTSEFSNVFEQQARENMAAEIRTLTVSK
jgi:predicted metal-dependent HD superfamily phosphohydrolase